MKVTDLGLELLSEGVQDLKLLENIAIELEG